MKKLISFLLAAVLIMSVIPFAVGASGTNEEMVFTYKSTGIDGIEENEGNVIVDVYMTVKSETASFWGFDIALAYNKGLTLANVVFGNALPNYDNTPFDNANADCLVVLSQNNGFRGDVTLAKGEYLVATLTLKAEDTFKDKELEIFFDPDIAGTVARMEDENDMIVEFVPVKENEVTNYGDANGDGKINGKDYAMILQHINGWSTTIDEANADVNGDGKINGKDYALLLQHINGWEVTFGPK